MNQEQIERTEILIGRVIDGEASEAEFDELRSIAAVESSVWRDLAEAQRETAEIADAVGHSIEVADRVELPIARSESSRWGRGSLLSAGGWIAAAVLLVAWIGSGGSMVTGPGSMRIPQSAAGLVPTNAADALDRYLSLGREEGQVLGEVPTGVVLERRPLPEGGGYEVIYLRQIMERTVVEDVYEIARDDAGNPETVRVTPAGPASAH